MRRGTAPRLSLKARALQWLAQREHSRLELRRKLLAVAALEEAGAVADADAGVAADAGADGRFGTDDGTGIAVVVPGAVPERSSAVQAPAGVRRTATVPPSGRSGRPAVTPEAAARVEALLDWLEARGYLSDARFVDSRVRARSARLGTLRIRQELAQHGVELGPEAAQALKTEEPARAEALWQRKFGEPAADAAGRARQMRFLAARGFDPEVVRRVVPPARRRPEPDAGDD